MYPVPAEITVLAVDDDKKFTEIISCYLSEDPRYIVITAESGKEALDIISTHQVSAIIADYQMPEMDGLDLLRILRNEGNDIPFIIFTGQGCESVAIEALNEGADFYLIKGEDPGPQFLVLRNNLGEIVSKRQADAALILSETENRRILSLLRATLDATEDGILVETIRGDIAWYNERLLQLLNLNADQVEGRKLDEVISSILTQLKDPSVFSETKGEERTSNSDQTYELITFKDGRIIERHARPQICEGALVGRVWSYHDLTARFKAEQALRESRDRFRILFDNSPISHQALAEDGTILEVNQTFLSMLGYAREEIIGRQFNDLCDPSNHDIFSACFLNIKAGIPAYSHELILLHKDGTQIIVIADCLAVKIHDGSILQIQCALRDITSQRKTEEQLLWTESLLEEVVELLPFGICVTEKKENNIIFENTRFNEIWQLNRKSESESLDITLDKVMNNCHAEIKGGYLIGEDQSGLKPEDSSTEIILPEKRTLRSYRREFPNNNNDNRILWAFEDISRFKNQEEEIRKYARRLEILSKMISLSSRATKVQSLCEFTLQSIVPLMSVDGGCLYLINQDKETADLIYSIGITDDLKREIQTIKTSDFPDILINGDYFFSENISDFSPELTGKYSVGSVTMVTLPGGGTILGVICLFNSRKSPLNPEEESILIGAGREIGGALVRLQDQEALRNARRNLDNLVNSINDMVFVIDADSSTILEVNEEVLRHLGYCREDLIGRPVHIPIFMGYQIFPSDLFTENTIVREHIIPTAEGNLIHVETSTAPGFWNVRNAIFCVARDITESIIVQERVKRSEERLRAIFESSPIGIELYDAEGFLIDLNGMVQEIFGVPDRSSLIGHSFFSLPHIRKDMFDEINLGKTVTYEHVLDFTGTEQSKIYHSYKHEPIEVRIITTPLHMSSAGDNSGYLVLIEDITERKKANRLLADSEAFNRGLVANLPDYLMIYNHEGEILFINPSGITGMRAEGVVLNGASIFDFIISEQQPFAKNQMERRMRGEGVSPYELRIIRQDGTMLDVMVQATVIPYQGSDAVLVVLTDITSRKEAEEQLEKYTQVLQMTVAALGSANKKLNLLSDVTRHDILNQIHVILNSLDLMKDESDSGTCSQFLHIVEDAVGIIERQIQFTRSYQDLGINTPEWQNLTNIIDKLTGLDGRITDNTEGYILHADPLLPKVFENLLDNSIRHGGKVTHVDVQSSVSDDGDIIITWSDDGKGIPESEKEKIFEKGYGKNTGFGLFLIREILALTQIQITEIGKEGKGACFKIRVPQGSYRIEGRSGLNYSNTL
ncbi:MAG: hypothetical protein CVV33_00930 [Methanomicrobiales archaeon HGW-Methanomicrobiales-4]|nr:MAG: hypothetical protein CVV33_00930 [Methanomicrobiales archaeon HGW-Methanomicrobiales-4]